MLRACSASLTGVGGGDACYSLLLEAQFQDLQAVEVP